jgi:histidine kinase
MKLLRRLDIRLFVSYLLVIGVGAAALFLVAGLLAPTFFDSHLRSMARHGPGSLGAATEAELQEGLSSSVNAALAVGVAAAVIAAGVVAGLVTRRILRPLQDVRQATRRLAAGHYDQRVPVPDELELAALAEDVNALGTALEEVELRRLRLISELAHELRTPLATIEGYMEGLIDEVLPPTPEVFAEVADEAARLKRLAVDLSTLSRAEEGALQFELKDADLGELAGIVAERLRPQFHDQGVELTVSPGPEVPVRVDPDRVAQVFTNLIGNALTYTPPGGRVIVERGVDDSWGWVSVTDTGRGLPPEKLERIFERFYRTDPEGAGGGIGIGLTIARSIAQAHGGEITASSPGPGTGATFTTRFPLRTS